MYFKLYDTIIYYIVQLSAVLSDAQNQLNVRHCDC